MSNFAFYGYGFSGILFGLLSLLLVVSWRGRLQGGLLVLATLATALWALASSLGAGYGLLNTRMLWALELIRDLAWLAFLYRLLKVGIDLESWHGRMASYAARGASILIVAALFVLLEPLDLSHVGVATHDRANFLYVTHLLLSVLALVVVEQLFRNTPAENRWGIKYLCFGLGLLYTYDFYFYSDALLFRRIDSEIWSARGVVSVLSVPLIGITAARNPKWSLPLYVSRRVVFHTTALMSAGIYMLIMALAGYYIRLYGGEWGSVLQLAFLFGAVLVLIMLLFSGQLRSRVKVMLNKHFFHYRYDYREEWLHVIGLLSGQKSNSPLFERVIHALGEIVDSPGGLIWLCDDRGCALADRFNHPEINLPPFECGHPLMKFLAEKRWVIDLDELKNSPDVYDHLQLPDWLETTREPWLILPLIHDDAILGFVILQQPRAPQHLNWESLDLLKTAGMQAASYIALHRAANALAEARQFEGFNRLSAFVMHDLKNLIAQLSLVTKNAARHKHNPEFIEDAVGTIQNAVDKMQRLMNQLKSAEIFGRRETLSLKTILNEVIAAKSAGTPKPKLICEVPDVSVSAEPDRLSSVLGHIVQNAQDATSAQGKIMLELREKGDQAIVVVTDTGVGMDKSFIENRLFRPFDSTKGLTGMGIGAYECREYIRSIGGEVKVDSTLDVGSVFTIYMPCAKVDLPEAVSSTQEVA